MKRFMIFLLTAACLLGLCGCQKTRIVHCDRCGEEIEVKEDSNITEDWIVFCKNCEEPVVEPG